MYSYDLSMVVFISSFTDYFGRKTMGSITMWICLILTLIHCGGQAADDASSDKQLEWDPKGYIIFCLCMGK